MKIIITSPSLDTYHNVSGISSVTNFIIKANPVAEYIHFELGKRDNDKRGFSWFLRIVKSFFKWMALLAGNRGSIVHFNFAVDKLGLLRDFPFILAARISGKRVIFHLHGGEYLLRKKVPGWMRAFLKIIFSGTNPAIVLNADEAAVLKQKYKCRQVFTLPNCIDLTGAKLFERKAGKDILKILFMGRISLNKGLEYIFKALQNLKEKGYMFEFYMAGKGPEEVEYIRKFNSALGNSFIFKGVVSGDSKKDILETCNVFLLPSFFEGMPIALLESMAYGLVPIATAVGGIKNLIKDGENGLVVKIKSESEIEDAIKKLFNAASYRRELSEKARQSIFLNYNAERYIGNLNNIYRDKYDINYHAFA